MKSLIFIIIQFKIFSDLLFIFWFTGYLEFFSLIFKYLKIFPDGLLLLISNLITWWSKNVLCIVLIPSMLLRFALWHISHPGKYMVCIKCAVCYLLGECYINFSYMKMIDNIIQDFYSCQFLCLHVPKNINGAFPPPVLSNFSVSPLISVSSSSIYIETVLLVTSTFRSFLPSC